MPRTPLAAALALILVAAGTAQTSRRRPSRARKAPTAAKPATRKKSALLVLVENNGVNLGLVGMADAVKAVPLPLLSCGNLPLYKAPSQELGAYLGQLTETFRWHPGCLNPGLWKTKTMSADQVVQRTIDFYSEEVLRAVHGLQGLKEMYDQVVVLEDERCTVKKALKFLDDFRRAKLEVDIHVLLHGAEGYVQGAGFERFDEASFFGELRRRNQTSQKLHLRTVFQMNCESGTLVEAWRGLGAKAVSAVQGTRLNYLPQDYVHFLARWAEGETFGEAVQHGFETAALYSRPLYTALGKAQWVRHSHKQVTGDPAIRLRPPAPKTPVAAARDVVRTNARAARGTAVAAAQSLADAGKAAVDGNLGILAAAVKGNAQILAGLVEAGMAAGKSAGPLMRELVAQSHELTAVAREVMVKYGLASEDMVEAMLSASFTLGQVFRVCDRVLAMPLEAALRIAKTEGLDCGAIAAAALAEYEATKQDVARGLRKVGFGTSAVARALHRQLGCTVKQTARLLKGAGSRAEPIAKALRSQLGQGFAAVAEALKDAGFGVDDVARALGGAGATVAQITTALVGAFQQSAAWVAARLATLGLGR